MPVSIDGADTKICLVGAWFDRRLDLPTGYAIYRYQQAEKLVGGIRKVGQGF